MKAASSAGWVFVAPALIVIARVLRVPVLAALALSFTDFDIYALADLAQPALRRARQLCRACCRTPLFWQALGNTLYFVVVGVPLSIAVSLGAALLLNSQLARVQAASFALRSSRPW